VFVLPPANMQYLTGEHMRKSTTPSPCASTLSARSLPLRKSSSS
jgi:hypothetical protein